MVGAARTLDEDFAGDTLDRTLWFPYYLPHWSSRAASAATWSVSHGELRLSIPPDQPLWCPDLHDEPLRVSCIQSGAFSGPVGSTIGQQPFRAGLTVREAQPSMWGYIPHFATVEIRMWARITSRSMFACWLSGIEDRPERSGEICVAEVFGDTVAAGTADVGIGLHQFRDPALSEDFGTVALPLDVTEPHTYAVDWRPGSVTFTIDGRIVGRRDQAPDYPMQLMIGVFDFPGRAKSSADPPPTPELIVSHVRGRGRPPD